MTTEPTTLPPEQFNEIVRVVRETIRAEIRDEFAARKPGVVDARTALQRSQDYEVPATIDGYPI